MRAADQVFTKEILLSHPLDRGTFGPGKQYEKGDIVRYGGHLYIATQRTKTAAGPGDAKNGVPWQMMIRRPADGKDGKDAPQ
jgi:hypothetical protein